MAAWLSSGRLATHALAWALALAAHGESPASCLSTSAEYTCIANTSCGNEAMATHLGPMSLEACLAACQGFQDCQVIQYHCNTFCLLLRDCGTHADTACGGSLYLRNLDRAPGTALTTESVDLSKCYEGYAGDGQVLDDFTCTEASYCSDKGWGVKDHHGMSLLRCSALCRATNCQAFQFGCSNSCTLFPTITGCTVKGPSTCSSIYWRLHNRSETEVSLALGRTAAYSPQACSFQGCWVSAQCPANSRPVACQTVPPNSGHGVYSTDQGCAAQGSGEAILAEAICVQGFNTSSVRSAWGIDNMTLSCPSGFLPVACNCLQNSWSVGEPCTGLNEFPPTLSADGHLVCTRYIDSGLGTYVRMSWNIGARISAICLPTTGTVQEYSLFNTRDSAGSAAESEARYCGWAKTHIRNDVDCSAWMRNPLPDGGCNMSECQGLADCAEVCTACSVCQGIYFYLGWGNVDDASYSQSPARCYFQGDTLNNINMAVEGYPSVATASSPWAVYVNSRDARCGPERFLRGVSFFQDSLCTELVVPSTLVASAYKDGTNYTLRAGWWKIPSRFAPRSCSSCPAKSLRIHAVFDTPVSVLCAIVDSSVDFAAGWTLSQGSSIDSAFAQSVSGSLVAFGSAHKSRSAPVMVRGATATLRGTMLLACALSVCPKDSIYLPQLLAGAMASVLGLRQHMIDFHGSPVRSEDKRQAAQSYAFVMMVKIVVSTPADVGSYLNAAALLKHMRYHLAVLTEALQELHSLPFTVQQLSPFTEHVSVPQALHALPTLPTPRASTTTPITTRPLQELAGSLNDLGHSAYFIAFVGLIVPILGFILILAILALLRLHRRVFQDKWSRRRTPGGVVLGKALQRSEEERSADPLSESVAESLPEYWAAAGCEDSGRQTTCFDGLVYARHEHLDAFQHLVDFTYRSIATQDRLCPTREHGKTRGGCPCVRPGGDPGLPTGYAVRQVVRAENSDRFEKYLRQRGRIKESRQQCDPPTPAIFTWDALRSLRLQHILSDLDDDVNEVYLWHGTSVRDGLTIALTDFNLALAGSGGGTMYGRGLYFSESVTKADEYSKTETGGRYEDIRALLLCRVCLGKFHYTLEREPAAILKFGRGQSDSTLGDRARAVNTYREMCVYNTDQVYPEYLVLYQRLHGGESAPRLMPEAPFLLELPLYWKNVDRNPAMEAFREHWMVKPRICELIQLLADETASGAALEVLSARRVEDSGLWLQYVAFKQAVHEKLRLSGQQRCTPPQDLARSLGNGSLWAALDAERLEARDLSVAVNELLLWHGTSREAAESIAERGFEISERSTHGRRYGPGVYLAEDLSKSISYCPDKAGPKYVLLCRAVCGQIFYTEKGWHDEAGEEAARSDKHCVLANPGKQGPREYILLQSAQVYPEYIVEIGEASQPDVTPKQTRVYALTL